MGKKYNDKPQPTYSPEEVRTHVERILASKAFERSKSLSSFLQFVVAETLSNGGARLKARTIAIGALRRGKNFDSRVDPIVSIQASRLRRALATYYETEGLGETIRITLPKGTFQPQFGPNEVAEKKVSSVPATPLSSTGGPCVTVVPLVELEPSQGSNYFSVGLTQEIIAAIASFPELTVVNTPPLENGESVAGLALRVSRDVSARFMLSGTLRKDDRSVILRMQLTELPSAEVIWTEKIKRDLSASQLMDLEEEIAEHVARTVGENYGVIPRRMSGETRQKGTHELSVYDAVLRHRHYQCVATSDARDDAIEALERAIQLDPNYALCWAMLSEAVCDAYGLRIDCRSEVVTRAKELARRAIALDPNCQHARWSLAYAHFHAREREAFLKMSESVISLNPNNGFLVGVAAWAIALVGEWERGLSILRRLMEQNPYYPTWMHLAPYLDHYRKGEFDAALDHANMFNLPTLAWDPILRAAALANVGRQDEAVAAIKQLASTFPAAAADPAHYMRGYIFVDEIIDQVVEGLRKADTSKTL